MTDISDLAFKCDDLPCPKCGNCRIIGYLFLNQYGRHQHTHYVCTWWPSDGGNITERCGWHGWTVPAARNVA